jgi:DNA-binding beta-propeller fold protein YncE
VHSGKFDQEKDQQHIKNAVLRHNIEHPVAVDSDYAIWNAYGVHGWPTLVVIDPEGFVVGAVSGEGHRDGLDRVVARLLEEHKAKGTLADKSLTFKRERETFKSGELEFPGKVLADTARNRLFIADTNHHRILVTDLGGKQVDVIGLAAAGFFDGPFERAQLHQPQGMALSADGNTLYIADTENHAIRAADLSKRTLTTIAGTGKQGNDRRPHDAKATETTLSSPWDLARVGDTLFIAMAGMHEIWRMDLQTSRVNWHAGTGSESSDDGPNHEATFAQPSGLATDGKTLYVADSESSSIRAVDVKDGGQTRTVAGSNNLFGFGLADGKGSVARFQHPLGVALAGADVLFVADTFNNVIRRIDLKTDEVTRWLGTGKSEPGAETSAGIGFSEPGGLSIGGDVLYVADTNHHRIVAIDRKTKTPHVLKIESAKK